MILLEKQEQSADLHRIFCEILDKPPSHNVHQQLEPKQPLIQKDLDASIQSISDPVTKLGIESLAKRVFWMGGNRYHPGGFIVSGYSFAEIIGKSGIYFYDSLRMGLFVQAPRNDYPAHAHDSEEWYLILSGSAKWIINDQTFHAEEGHFLHHPPCASHRFVTSDQPLLALWIRTGNIQGRYWFVGHEDVAQIGEKWQQLT